mmetsp:Transcript_15354/g.29631  ORF Transcript_15354/g.29631 Transcript_15354/m.29631 type:complete len:96 (+) Transcript_15354:396-683(+)
MLGQTCPMPNVNESSEVHQQAERTCQQSIVYEASKQFVSYGYALINTMPQWRWRDVVIVLGGDIYQSPREDNHPSEHIVDIMNNQISGMDWKIHE